MTTPTEDAIKQTLADWEKHHDRIAGDNLAVALRALIEPPAGDDREALVLADDLVKINDEFEVDTLGARLAAIDLAAGMLRRLAARQVSHPEPDAEKRAVVAEGKITRALEVVMDKRDILSPYVSRDELRRILTEGYPE